MIHYPVVIRLRLFFLLTNRLEVLNPVYISETRNSQRERRQFDRTDGVGDSDRQCLTLAGKKSLSWKWIGKNISTMALWQPGGSALLASSFPGYRFFRRFCMRLHTGDTDDELHNELSQLGGIMIYPIYKSVPNLALCVSNCCIKLMTVFPNI